MNSSPMMSPDRDRDCPKVSILIPAYKAKYLKETLESLNQQEFQDYEVVIGDDCPGLEVQKIVNDFLESNPLKTVRYQRNELTLGEANNLASCIARARGEFIKPLYDDDVLAPNCLGRYVDVLSNNNQVSLVSSLRQRIDEAGNPLPDIAATHPYFKHDVILDGEDVVSFLADITLNFLGEPSAFMFRKKDYQKLTVHGGVFSIGKHEFKWIGDLALAVKLLRCGDFALLNERCVLFRISRDQTSFQGNYEIEVVKENHEKFGKMLRAQGWYVEEGNYSIRTRDLCSSEGGGYCVDLATLIRKFDTRFKGRSLETGWGVKEWLDDREPSRSRRLLLQSMLQANVDVGTLGIVVIANDACSYKSLTMTIDSLKNQHRSIEGVWLIGNHFRDVAFNYDIQMLDGTAPWPAILSKRIASGGMPDFLWIIHAGDCLVPYATLMVGEYRLRNPAPLAWYADEMVWGINGPERPILKPDLNIDFLRSYPYIGRNLVISSAAVEAVGGLDERFGDLALIDFVWRLVEGAGSLVIGHIAEVLIYHNESLMEWLRKSDILTLAPAVTREHFHRMGSSAQVDPGHELGLWAVRHPLDVRPLISVIIPTRDQLPILRGCIEGFMERTAYPNYELIIVDNGSVEADALHFIKSLESIELDQVRVLRWNEEFNFSKINNYAAAQARGQILLFLNNDIEFTENTRSDWLELLLSHALRPEVGVVGSRLDRPNGVIDQCGQILGLNGSVGGALAGVQLNEHVYMSRHLVQQNVTALSAVCMMMRREIFEELGGFDTELFPIFFGDTDLCIRATELGYLLVLEPDTGLVHLGGATRLIKKKFGIPFIENNKQREILYEKWLPQLANDGNYHPALTKHSPGYSLCPDAARIQSPLPGRPLPVVLATHSDWGGCGFYRIMHPFSALVDDYRIEGGLQKDYFNFMDVARIKPDVVILKHKWNLDDIRRYRDLIGVEVALDFDDYLPNIPTRSIHRKEISQSVIKKMRRAIETVDWIVVSTPELANEYSKYHDDIRVALNGLNPTWWRGVSGQRRVGRKMRVGWAGGSSHSGDLAEIQFAVKDLADEVEWVFMGMKPKGVDCEFHAGVPIEQYPQKLASLDLDLAVVPLEVNQFNRCKSNLRLLELGACGVPIICTDIEPFRCGLPVTLVSNRYHDWVEAVRAHIADPDYLARTGDELRDIIHREWMLEGAFLDQWSRAWGAMR